jgi:hypothetical protein
MRPLRAAVPFGLCDLAPIGDIPSVAVFQTERGISRASPRLSDSNRIPDVPREPLCGHESER